MQVTKENYRIIKLTIGVVAVTLLAIGVWTLWDLRQVAIRSHNLEVFYKSMTCDDLPLKNETTVAACEQALGRFMIKEYNLFTR
jgi:hypothetical protein